MPCIVAPSSWRSTSCGLMAVPDVGDRRRAEHLDHPVSRSTATSAAPMQTSQKTGPSAYEPVPSGWTPPSPMSCPPDRPNRRGDQLRVGPRLVTPFQAAPSRSSTDPTASGQIVAPMSSRSWRTSVAARWTASPASVVERLAPGRPVVRGELRVGALAGDPFRGHGQDLRRDLREGGPLALADLGRADQHDRARHPPPSGRSRSRRGGRRPPADPRTRRARCSGPARAIPAQRLGDLVRRRPTRSASSGLPPGRTCSPGRSRLRRRISIGSMPARRATSSTWSSPAHWRCVAPNAR